MTLHLLHAGGLPRTVRPEVAKAVRKAYAYATTRLPIGQMDVVVQAQGGLTLPDIGVGAYTPSAELVFVFLDPRHLRLRQSLQQELAPLVAHELMHAARWRGPGYGITLGEALVSEGLALHFESGLRGCTPWYAQATDPSSLAHLEVQARTHWQEADYDRLAWFSPTPDAQGLRYRGYVLGHFLVARRLAAWRICAAAAWDTPADAF